MSYTAIDKMRRMNRKRFGKDLGPFLPEPFAGEKRGMDLKSTALRFLDRRCTGLRHDAGIEKAERKEKRYYGRSLRPGQIPYNMQMDLDRLCLKNELAKFIDSGVAEDAYTVYYAFIEMFIGEGGKSQSMVELLSEFESNASSLLMSHRDHYSHSVYVFALGLAIYETNPWFRQVFSRYYGFPDSEGHASACAFLEYWGLTALFHDVGYPFEIPFEQILAYFEVDRKKRGPESVYIAYKNREPLIRIEPAEQEKLKALYGGRVFRDVTELLAAVITEKLGAVYGFTEDFMDRKIRSKAGCPEENGYFMDHAFFSAGRLYQELARILKAEKIEKYHIDALTAIMLHNSLFKFAIVGYKSDNLKAPLKAELHPLAWMLMLCDELQCWDRTAYGRNSRNELHPMAVDFSFAGQAIRAKYYYDREERDKITAYKKQYAVWEKEDGDPKTMPRLKAYSDMAEKKQRFSRDIRQIVDLEHCPLTVLCTTRRADHREKHTYLSISSFLHIYNFAVALHNGYLYDGREEAADREQMEKDFNDLSLEYKISNINQVRAFDRYLNVIGCFYTDQPVDFEMLSSFTPEMAETIAPLEHVRWVRDHELMGWSAGDIYETLTPGADKDTRADLREQLRMHKHTVPRGSSDEEIKAHYLTLPPAVQGLDSLPFNSMLRLLKKYDGVRIYRLK